MKKNILTLLTISGLFFTFAQSMDFNCNEIDQLIYTLKTGPSNLLGEKIVEVESSIWGDFETIYYTPTVSFQDAEAKGYIDDFGTYVVYTIVDGEESKELTYKIANGLIDQFNQCLGDEWTLVHPEQTGKADKYFYVQAEDVDKGDNIKEFVKPYISFSIYQYKTFTLKLSFLDPLAKGSE